MIEELPDDDDGVVLVDPNLQWTVQQPSAAEPPAALRPTAPAQPQHVASPKSTSPTANVPSVATDSITDQTEDRGGEAAPPKPRRRKRSSMSPDKTEDNKPKACKGFWSGWFGGNRATKATAREEPEAASNSNGKKRQRKHKSRNGYFGSAGKFVGSKLGAAAPPASIMNYLAFPIALLEHVINSIPYVPEKVPAYRVNDLATFIIVGAVAISMWKSGLQLIAMVVATCLPLQRVFKAIKTEDVTELIKWCHYFILVGVGMALLDDLLLLWFDHLWIVPGIQILLCWSFCHTDVLKGQRYQTIYFWFMTKLEKLTDEAARVMQDVPLPSSILPDLTAALATSTAEDDAGTSQTAAAAAAPEEKQQQRQPPPTFSAAAVHNGPGLSSADAEERKERVRSSLPPFRAPFGTPGFVDLPSFLQDAGRGGATRVSTSRPPALAGGRTAARPFGAASAGGTAARPFGAASFGRGVAFGPSAAATGGAEQRKAFEAAFAARHAQMPAATAEAFAQFIKQSGFTPLANTTPTTTPTVPLPVAGSVDYVN